MGWRNQALLEFDYDGSSIVATPVLSGGEERLLISYCPPGGDEWGDGPMMLTAEQAVDFANWLREIAESSL